MRNSIRSSAALLSVLALLVPGPLAAAPSSAESRFAAVMDRLDAFETDSWIRSLFSWLDRLLPGGGIDGGTAELRLATAPEASTAPVSPEPGFEISPQAGWASDPNG